ncbi:MAG: RIP metalloprotease RseP, partial [Pseudoxanthomonas sp.]
MSDFLQTGFWFLVTLGVLVSFHEFGHFWVARRCGVQVLTYSVGFGRALWSRVGRDGTRYQIAAVPLGGYVKFLDSREYEVPPADFGLAFDRQVVWKRMLIVLAGPVANLLLCLALLWAAFMIGWPGHPPLLGPTSGIAQQAGLRDGDRLVSVNGSRTPTWDDALTPLALAEIDRAPASVSVRSPDGSVTDHVLRFDRLAEGFDQTDPLGAAGISALLLADHPIVGAVQGPADGILQPGDRIVRLGGKPTPGFSDIRGALQLAVAQAPSTPVQIDIVRNGRPMTVAVRPHQVDVANGKAWQLGIAAAIPAMELQRFGPLEAAVRAGEETRKQAGEMLGFIGRLVSGKASSKNLSGVIGIAQVARSEAQAGVSRMFRFMAVLSLTLCIMNLLPIPVLDGGHLLYYLIELVSGRPVGERVLVAGQFAGLALLVGLIC